MGFRVLLHLLLSCSFSVLLSVFLLLHLPIARFVLPNKYVPQLQDKSRFDIAWMGPLSDGYQTDSGLCVIRVHVYMDKRVLLWDGMIEADERLEQKLSEESIVLRTDDQEIYKCILPEVKDGREENGNPLIGIQPEELLSNILNGNTKCSYRLEPYWTYEVCHGLHVRQFHEEKDGDGMTKLQEFYLGNSKGEGKKQQSDEKSKDNVPFQQNEPGSHRKIQTINIDGRLTPYYNHVIGNGTPCDLNNGQPRKVNIIYICHPSSSNEVMSVKETTTCEYEVIILNPNLCENPAFRVKDEPIHQIRCHSLDGSPSRPTILTDHEIDNESEQFRYEKPAAESTSFNARQEEFVQPKATTDDPLKGETASEVTEKLTRATEDATLNPPPENSNFGDVQADDQLTKEFLQGEYCLRGGSGWWKYEFCYGKHISQYHEDEQKKTTIYLGYWDAETHLDWVKQKRRVRATKYLIHFYSNGDMCDLTGKPRNAQVKLKCKKGRQVQEMSIYLLEPSPCEYIVGVESPVLCPLISKADENALIDHHYR